MPTLLPTDPGPQARKLGTLSCVSLITNKMIGTGLFSTPSIIYRYCSGNVTLFLGFWIIGAIIVFAGLLVYLEYALNLPFRNGGEKNYLLRVFDKPKGLVGCMYAFQMVLLGFSTGNSFAFGKYLLFAITGEQQEDNWISKAVGVACLTFCVGLHVRYPNQGTSLFNFLGVFKILVLLLIVAIGGMVALGLVDASHTVTLKSAKMPLPGYYSIAVALLEIIYSFKGWENANYVLLNVSDPYHVLTIAAPVAVFLVTLLYFLVVVSYLVVIPKEELLNSGVLVAGIFFNKVFGESITARVLPILILLLTLGNVMVVSFAHAHVNQELALNNYLPFSKYFENINNSLWLHWAISVIILVGPPSAEVYEFVVNLYIYPGTWINVFLAAGLIYLKLNAKLENWGQYNDSAYSMESEEIDPETSYTEFDLLLNENTRFSIPYIGVLLFLFANVFMALLPYFPPPPEMAGGSIPYWCFPVVGTGCILLGAFFYYWRQIDSHWRSKAVPLYEEDYNPSLL